MNWWIEDGEIGIRLNISLHIQGVMYMYRQEYQNFNDIPIPIKTMLTSNRSVLGYLSEDNKSLNIQNPQSPKQPLLGIRLQADFLEHGAEQL